VKVDGLPGGVFPATVGSISGAAARGFIFDTNSGRKFDTTLQLTSLDERLRCGLSANVVISGEQLEGRPVLHKLRTLLTMLGMIFGVAAVLSMMSIGAGAQQQVMAFIEDLGVRT
jgi:hypothetical protein